MKLFKNFLYNLMYQIFTLIVPLVTIPYISRVLGPRGIGVNTFTTSVSQYFVLLATLGITTYGQREIAYFRKDKKKLSQIFWEIEFLSIITSVISLVLFLFFILFVFGDYKQYYFLQTILIFSCAADVSWFFNGLEKFKVTVLRNFIFKILSVIMIFLFVKKYSDLSIYIFIVSCSTFLGNLSLWTYLKGYLCKVNFTNMNIMRHLRPTLLLFLPQVAINIYVFLNKIMLGSMSSVEEAGFFDSSDKIVRMCLTLITALTTVMMPRVANAYANGDNSSIKTYLKMGFGIAIMFSIPIFFGLESIAAGFIPWFFGKNFLKVVPVIYIELFAIIPIAFSQILGIQYLVPIGKTKQYSIAIVLGAIVNLLCNIPLIYFYSAIGTAIATVISETCITLFEFLYVSKNVSVISLFDEAWKPFFAGLIMFITVKFFNYNLETNIINLFIEIFIGGIIYIAVLLLLRYSTLVKIKNTLLAKK
ncbi:flippase [Liquorilactobacillus uvarum]|uniref:PST family polysaccharide transporter n=1 Tax=Liquorilactobacillus uvarum DSM 19971 TaxID=1423812 RepID=A0A0R1Q322_9LACO|nr:flippase [Liquorilactobacillus uvarum]KRL36677.1 PST family polysaccharide transporter [Liquorilactobacillus uvarum DSM 19971]